MSGKAESGQPGPSQPERLTKQVTLLGSLIGIFVTLNALIVGCSNTAVSRATSYRAAVAQEEQFWSKLYDRYLQAIATNDEEEDRRKKLMAIAILATHDTPDFAEFRGWLQSGDEPDPAAVDIDKMRQVLFEALTDESVSSPEIAQEIAFFLDQKTSVRERAAPEEQGAQAEKPPAVTADAERRTEVAQQAQAGEAVIMPASSQGLLEPVTGSTILTAGASDGWDMDVFWCTGEGDAANYTRAVGIASALARPAAEGKTVANGVKLGRVRLRSLPESQQQNGFYTRRGPAVIWDPGPGEEEAAKGVAAFLGRSNLAVTSIPSRGAQTKWYLSVFVCGLRES